MTQKIELTHALNLVAQVAKGLGICPSQPIKEELEDRGIDTKSIPTGESIGNIVTHVLRNNPA